MQSEWHKIKTKLGTIKIFLLALINTPVRLCVYLCLLCIVTLYILQKILLGDIHARLFIFVFPLSIYTTLFLYLTVEFYKSRRELLVAVISIIPIIAISIFAKEIICKYYNATLLTHYEILAILTTIPFVGISILKFSLYIGIQMYPLFVYPQKINCVSAVNALRVYGISDADSFLNFIRLYNLNIYRVKVPLNQLNTCYVACHYEPLIKIWTYPSKLCRDGYANNIFCLEKSEYDKLRDTIEQNFDEQIIRRATTQIDMGNVLKLQELKDELVKARNEFAQKELDYTELQLRINGLVKQQSSKSNLGLGPASKNTTYMLLLFAQVYPSLKTMEIAVTKWGQQAVATAYQKENLRDIYTQVVRNEEVISRVIKKVDPSANAEQINDNMLTVLRLALNNKATWGGNEKKPTLDSIVDKVDKRKKSTPKSIVDKEKS